jgi:hypothetical protein
LIDLTVTGIGGMMKPLFNAQALISARSLGYFLIKSGLFLNSPAWTPSLPLLHSPNLLSPSLLALKPTSFLEHRWY